MNAREILNDIDVLQAIQKEPTSISDAAAICSSSQSKVRRFIGEYEYWGLVRRSGEGYILTTAGDLILREYDGLDDETQAGLVSLAKSENRIALFRAIENHPADKAELARVSGTSRSTVHRNLDTEWTKKENGYIRLSSSGEELIEAYENFTESITVIEEKIEFLKRYEGRNTGVEIPLEALAESRQVVSTMEDRQKVVREVNDMDPGDAEPLRALSHSFSSQVSDESYEDLSPEADAELIVDRSVYKVITNPKNWKYLLKSRDYPNFQILVLPESVTVALGKNGSEEAVIAAYSDEYPLHVGLFSENKAFVRWVTELYEHFRANANPIPKDLIKWAAGR